MKAKDNPKIMTAWTFYDWANSVYPLIINATIFPIYYEMITNKNGSDIVEFLGFQFINTSLYAYSLSFAFLLIAFLSPLLCGIADYTGRKKGFMQFFCYLGSISCLSMYFFTENTMPLGILLVILSSIGFSGSIVFYNAYLPEIASREKQDHLSARGFSMGYIGSTILLIANLLMYLRPEWFGDISPNMAARISFLTVGIWWIVFAQIPFYYLPSSVKTKIKRDYIFYGYRELVHIWKKSRTIPILTRFLIAFFVFNIGINTVLLQSTLFGKKVIRMEPYQLLFIILIIQWVAALGAYLFSYVSSIKGNLVTLQATILIYTLATVFGFFIVNATQFYLLAMVIGLVMGGSQSLARSTYSKMLPPQEEHASFFSFYDVCEKLGVVIGMGIFGLIETLTSNMRYPLIFIGIIFFSGFLLLGWVKKANRAKMI